MTRREAERLLASLAQVHTLGGRQFLIENPHFSYEGRWLTFDVVVLPSGPGIAVMPQNPPWGQLRALLGLDALTVDSFETLPIGPVRTRVAATFVG